MQVAITCTPDGGDPTSLILAEIRNPRVLRVALTAAVEEARQAERAAQTLGARDGHRFKRAFLERALRALPQ
jgi:hypothetical protein